jgi:hypothetical protein
VPIVSDVTRALCRHACAQPRCRPALHRRL